MAKLVALFPGQGSQKTGMGRFLFDEFAEAKQVFEEASDAISLNLKRLCFEGPDADLSLTENTQPALLTVSTAAWRVVHSTLGLRLAIAAGHSVGEYAACVAAGAMPFAKAVRAVKRRGQAMQSAVPIGLGGMSAVMGLTDEQVKKMCHWAVEAMAGDGLRDQVLEPANFNSPGQVVISGHLRALDWLKLNFSPEAAFATADSIKAKFIPLPVSAPFHCRMMKPAETVMAQVLGEIEFVDASCPIVQNISAEPETKGERLRSALVAQVSGAVRWTESMACILSMAASAENKPASEGQGKTVLVELGAGRVLAGLCKKIAPEAPAVLGLITIDDLKALEAQIV